MQIFHMTVLVIHSLSLHIHTTTTQLCSPLLTQLCESLLPRHPNSWLHPSLTPYQPTAKNPAAATDAATEKPAVADAILYSALGSAQCLHLVSLLILIKRSEGCLKGCDAFNGFTFTLCWFGG